MELVYTVNPGIEDVGAEEVLAELGGDTRYELMSGRIYHVVDNINIESIYRLRSINRVILLLWRGRIGRRYEELLEDIKGVYGISGLSRYVSPLNSFAVVSERIGEHEYTSMDVSRILGDIVIKMVYEETGLKPRVDLRTPDVVIYAFIRETEIFIGILLSGPHSLHRRGYRIYNHPAALKPTLAYAMLRFSGTKDKQVIIDPMCGGGTIPIEAALLHEDAEIYCYDINPRHIRGAKQNALAAGVSDKIFFGVWDARRIDELNLEPDHMISNPPYGIRYGDPSAIRRLYYKYLESASKILRAGGRITMITTEYNYVSKIADKLGYRIIMQRMVKHGGLYPRIIVLEKT